MISVVIPAYRAEATLERCLAALLAAGCDDITVVDDGSPDRTADIARAQGVKVLRLDGQHGAAAARNAGAAASTGAVLLFVDADVVIRPGAVEKIKAAFADPDLAAVFGAYDDAPSEPGAVSTFRNLLHHHVHMGNAGPATTFWTGLGAVRREAFVQVGGFDPEQRMMEDVKLGLDLSKAGYAIRLDPTIQGTHLKRWTLRGMLRTDLLHRAIPWLRLMRDQPHTHALNAARRGKIAVASVGVSLAAAAAAVIWPQAALLALAAFGVMLVAERSFLRFMLRRRGVAAALTAAPLLWLHHLAAGLGVLWVLLRG